MDKDMFEEGNILKKVIYFWIAASSRRTGYYSEPGTIIIGHNMK